MQECMYILDILSYVSNQLHSFVVIYNNQVFVELNTVYKTNSKTFCSKNIILCDHMMRLMTNHNFDFPDLHFKVMFLYVRNTFLRSSMHIFQIFKNWTKIFTVSRKQI